MALINSGQQISRSLMALRQMETPPSSFRQPDEEPSLADVALARFSLKDRERIEKFLALAVRKATGPPRKRVGHLRETASTSARGPTVSTQGASEASSSSRVGSKRRQKLLLCWLQNETSPVQVMVSMDSAMVRLASNEKELSGAGLEVDTEVEIYSRKQNWVGIA
ncbi:hypothetical protein B0H17DRAFT_1123959 [Mycena rosella]|uniref:Uncharacterized protein n=1 Tax=Mycena rosella TaxID=1033263 RepID=A0AAD7MDA3_MYCRO|nr:hypothetical protein B0H17DRAFT_1123959 [Mycena rosella]